VRLRWQDYLERLKSDLPQDDPSVTAAIRPAESKLAAQTNEMP
jgi:hypothetical protein